MDKYVGHTGTIRDIMPTDGPLVGFEDGNAYFFPFFVLEKVDTFRDSARRLEVLEEISRQWENKKGNGDAALLALYDARGSKAEFHEAKKNFLLEVYRINFLDYTCCIYCPSTGPSKENKTCDSCEYAKTHGICLDYSREPSTYRALTNALKILRARILEY